MQQNQMKQIEATLEVKDETDAQTFQCVVQDLNANCKKLDVRQIHNRFFFPGVSLPMLYVELALNPRDTWSILGDQRFGIYKTFMDVKKEAARISRGTTALSVERWRTHSNYAARVVACVVSMSVAVPECRNLVDASRYLWNDIASEGYMVVHPDGTNHIATSNYVRRGAVFFLRLVERMCKTMDDTFSDDRSRAFAKARVIGIWISSNYLSTFNWGNNKYRELLPSQKWQNKGSDFRKFHDIICELLSVRDLDELEKEIDIIGQGNTNFLWRYVSDSEGWQYWKEETRAKQEEMAQDDPDIDEDAPSFPPPVATTTHASPFAVDQPFRVVIPTRPAAVPTTYSTTYSAPYGPDSSVSPATSDLSYSRGWSPYACRRGSFDSNRSPSLSCTSSVGSECPPFLLDDPRNAGNFYFQQQQQQQFHPQQQQPQPPQQHLVDGGTLARSTQSNAIDGDVWATPIADDDDNDDYDSEDAHDAHAFPGGYVGAFPHAYPQQHHQQHHQQLHQQHHQHQPHQSHQLHQMHPHPHSHSHPHQQQHQQQHLTVPTNCFTSNGVSHVVSHSFPNAYPSGFTQTFPNTFPAQNAFPDIPPQVVATTYEPHHHQQQPQMTAVPCTVKKCEHFIFGSRLEHVLDYHLEEFFVRIAMNDGLSWINEHIRPAFIEAVSYQHRIKASTLSRARSELARNFCPYDFHTVKQEIIQWISQLEMWSF